MKLSFSILIILFSFRSLAANVDTVQIYSDAMKRAYKCVVITPDRYNNSVDRYPVVYLLHGHGGWYANWIIRTPDLKKYADQYDLMIVCPDGGYNSWYLDSPVDTAVRFETYVSKEIPEWIDTRYRTIATRNGRAITGLSMGGHGGLFLGFRHSDTFGACGSMSGGVDFQPFKKNWQLGEKLGDTINYAENWKKYSVINIIENKPADSLAIIIDCGTEDFFFTVNTNLHEKMIRLNIPHDFIIRPGKHDWNYWRNAVGFQLLFFRNYFKPGKKD